MTSGGGSGIGWAVAIAMAKEGAVLRPVVARSSTV
jgi:NAD(P)-dependent dehydrogenase (short-subunit alcohol dehydrogenase family)